MERTYDDYSEKANKAIDHDDERGISKKKMLIIVGVAVLLLLVVWIWKEIELNKQANKALDERSMLQARAAAILADNNKEHLRLLAKPYVWAIRNEMLRGNINQLNVYANEMVKEKNFESVTVANDKGKIISSTNKKNEGNDFTAVGKPEYLASDTTIVENLNDSVLVMATPIMGFNNRLGTLEITYKVGDGKIE